MAIEVYSKEQFVVLRAENLDKRMADAQKQLDAHTQAGNEDMVGKYGKYIEDMKHDRETVDSDEVYGKYLARVEQELKDPACAARMEPGAADKYAVYKAELDDRMEKARQEAEQQQQREQQQQQTAEAKTGFQPNPGYANRPGAQLRERAGFDYSRGVQPSEPALEQPTAQQPAPEQPHVTNVSLLNVNVQAKVQAHDTGVTVGGVTDMNKEAGGPAASGGAVSGKSAGDDAIAAATATSDRINNGPGGPTGPVISPDRQPGE